MITSSPDVDELFLQCSRDRGQIHSAALATTQNLRHPADNFKLQLNIG